MENLVRVLRDTHLRIGQQLDVVLGEGGSRVRVGERAKVRILPMNVTRIRFRFAATDPEDPGR